jgi:hypothetical protein
VVFQGVAFAGFLLSRHISPLQAQAPCLAAGCWIGARPTTLDAY